MPPASKSLPLSQNFSVPMYCWKSSSLNWDPSISAASRKTPYTSSRSLTVVPAISKIASLNMYISYFQKLSELLLTDCFAQPHGENFHCQDHCHHDDEDISHHIELVDA